MSVKATSPVTFDSGKFVINDLPYPGDPKYFNLGESTEIVLRPELFGHPIHFHVNPILMKADPNRKSRGLPVGQYWTDTIYAGQNDSGVMPFDHWTGKTVVHCHILNHEDNGMMNVFEIRNPSAFPIAPLPGVLDMPSIPETAIALFQPDWPQGASVTPQRNAHSEITVYLFLPRPMDIASCAHCTAAAYTLASLRAMSDIPYFRIVAVTGPNIDGIPDLAAAMKLDPARDIICADGKLQLFAALGLIDGNPVYSEKVKRYTFPDSLNPDGTIRHASDVMHGFFIADPSGFITSARRGFRAHDDAVQISHELRTTGALVKAIIETARLGTTGANRSEDRNQRPAAEALNLRRHLSRFEEFQRSTK